MRFHAGQRDLVPALALRAGDDADGLPLRFENRSLLDMRLEIGADRGPAPRLALVADALERLAEADAVHVARGVDLLEAEQARRKAEDGFGTFETRAPDDVPVLWQRETPTEARGQVLPFRRRE